ncbi:uncharacterized protein [Drosophila tropicalis]|uniref:uncharacterized protein n=1 Tax=Drosophila tropicalis TaxID=46794 RepID=UPI0035AB969C
MGFDSPPKIKPFLLYKRIQSRPRCLVVYETIARMKTICLLLLFAILAVVALASPVPAGNDPIVQTLRYRNDQELEDIQRAIIAQYEKIGGTTQIHAPQQVSIANPYNIRINI